MSHRCIILLMTLTTHETFSPTTNQEPQEADEPAHTTEARPDHRLRRGILAAGAALGFAGAIAGGVGYGLSQQGGSERPGNEYMTTLYGTTTALVSDLPPLNNKAPRETKDEEAPHRYATPERPAAGKGGSPVVTGTTFIPTVPRR